MGRMAPVAEDEQQLSAEEHSAQRNGKSGKVPDQGRSGRYNSASSALDEDISTVREITNAPDTATPEKPIVSVNGRDVDPQEIDEAA